MKMRSFQAPTMREAMAQVRAAMGEDAIIIATHRSARGRGVTITAAVDHERTPRAAAAAGAAEPISRGELAERIARALAWHGAPMKLSERLAMAALDVPTNDPAMALSTALASTFRFRPLQAEAPARTMLIGPPGAGKTVTCAKLATQAALAGARPGLVTTDTVRAGGVEQLQAFTLLLQRPLHTAEQPDDLADTLARLPADQPCFIDTPGANPFAAGEMSDLRAAIGAAGAEPVLVLPQGIDASEAAELAAAFTIAGAKRLLPTRLDVGRRLGGLLAAAHGAGLAFCGATAAPGGAHGFHPLSATSLARLILRDPEREETTNLLEKAHAA